MHILIIYIQYIFTHIFNQQFKLVNVFQFQLHSGAMNLQLLSGDSLHQNEAATASPEAAGGGISKCCVLCGSLVNLLKYEICNRIWLKAN